MSARGQVLAVRRVAEEQDLAFCETLSIPHVQLGIHRNAES